MDNQKNTEIYKSQEKQEKQEKQKEKEKLYQELVDKGHKCISILETYPMKLIWCKKEICNH